MLKTPMTRTIGSCIDISACAEFNTANVQISRFFNT